MIYADYSATSIGKPECMAKAMCEVLDGEYGNASRGAHRLALRSLRAIDDARQAVANYFGLSAYWQLGFTPSATYALNLAIKSNLHAEDHAITTLWEHNAVLRPLYQTGASISFLPMQADQTPDAGALESLLQSNTKAIVCNLMSNVTGNILHLEPFKAFAKAHNLLLILDASQYAGQFPLQFNESFPKTLLAITGHKSLYGPMGSGALLAYGISELQPVNTGGSGIHSFDKEFPHCFPDVCEPGTVSLPAIVGLASAVQWLKEQDTTTHTQQLRKAFIEGLEQIPHVRYYGTKENGGACVSINIGTLPSDVVAARLDQEFEICVRAGAHCAPLVHKHYGTEKQGMLRFSFGFKSTLQDVEHCLQAIAKIAGEIK